jgi:hypothetical protein
VAWYQSPRRRLICTIVSRSRLLDAPASMRDELEVSYQKNKLTDPYVIALEIASVGRAGIPSDSFDKDRSLQLSLTAPILKVLAVERKPLDAPEPTIVANARIIELKPEQISKGEIIKASLLTEGTTGPLTKVLVPFTDVTVDTADREAEELKRRKRWSIVGLATPIAATIALILTVIGATLSISNANARADNVAEDVACLSVLEFGQATQFSMTLAYRDITAHQLRSRQLRTIAFAPSYHSDVDNADQQLRYLVAAYPSLEDSGIPLGNAASVSAYAKQASAIMARLPQEGGSAAAAKDLAALSALVNRLSNPNTVTPKQCN